jgi:hypothetical protein
MVASTLHVLGAQQHQALQAGTDSATYESVLLPKVQCKICVWLLQKDVSAPSVSTSCRLLTALRNVALVMPYASAQVEKEDPTCSSSSSSRAGLEKHPCKTAGVRSNICSDTSRLVAGSTLPCRSYTPAGKPSDSVLATSSSWLQ